MAAATGRRFEEVTRFFALQAFSGRSAYRKLAPTLQRDVRAFFGNVKAAKAAGKAMLFSVGDTTALASDAARHADTNLGHLEGGNPCSDVRG
jgi:hypothetical protein